ncbi:MAG: cellulase family glycosylhydrolase [Devosia sp.]|nr:cellulase family glycosylhydrolase [Devosia sp.]
MFNRRSACRLLLAGLAVGVAPAGASTKPAPGPTIPTRGFNLPGWIDREDGRAPSPQVLAKLRGLGFETIRLPVDPDLVGSPDASVRAGMLSKIEVAIGQVLDAGFRVILDLHPSGDLVAAFARDPQGAGRRALMAWTYLGDVMADLPDDSVYAELLNEPPLVRSDWLVLREALAAAVRRKCPSHTLVWGPARYQGIWELKGTPPLADQNAIASVHYYTPMGFTHQCENWDRSPLERIANLPFPASRQSAAVTTLEAKFQQSGDTEAATFLDREFTGDWTVARINADFADLGAWSRVNRSPVMLDEFGVLNFCVDAMSRVRWVEAVRRAAEANGAGWTYWEADAGFGFIEDRSSTEGFSQSMLAALTGDRQAREGAPSAPPGLASAPHKPILQ